MIVVVRLIISLVAVVLWILSLNLIIEIFKKITLEQIEVDSETRELTKHLFVKLPNNNFIELIKNAVQIEPF